MLIMISRSLSTNSSGSPVRRESPFKISPRKSSLTALHPRSVSDGHVIRRTLSQRFLSPDYKPPSLSLRPLSLPQQLHSDTSQAHTGQGVFTHSGYLQDRLSDVLERDETPVSSSSPMGSMPLTDWNLSTAETKAISAGIHRDEVLAVERAMSLQKKGKLGLSRFSGLRRSESTSSRPGSQNANRAIFSRGAGRRSSPEGVKPEGGFLELPAFDDEDFSTHDLAGVESLVPLTTQYTSLTGEGSPKAVSANLQGGTAFTPNNRTDKKAHETVDSFSYSAPTDTECTSGGCSPNSSKEACGKSSAVYGNSDTNDSPSKYKKPSFFQKLFGSSKNTSSCDALIVETHSDISANSTKAQRRHSKKLQKRQKKKEERSLKKKLSMTPVPAKHPSLPEIFLFEYPLTKYLTEACRRRRGSYKIVHHEGGLSVLWRIITNTSKAQFPSGDWSHEIVKEPGNGRIWQAAKFRCSGLFVVPPIGEGELDLERMCFPFQDRALKSLILFNLVDFPECCKDALRRGRSTKLSYIVPGTIPQALMRSTIRWSNCLQYVPHLPDLLLQQKY